MTKYFILYLILIIASFVAMIDGYFEWLDNDAKQYDLFTKRYDL